MLVHNTSYNQSSATAFVPRYRGMEVPDAEILDTVDIESIVSRTVLAVQKHSKPSCDTAPPSSAGSCYIQHRLQHVISKSASQKRDARTWHAVIRPQRCFASKACHRLYGKLHQTANARCGDLDSPRMITRHWKNFVKGSAEILARHDLHSDVAFSPRIGSKILISGLESWFSR